MYSQMRWVSIGGSPPRLGVNGSAAGTCPSVLIRGRLCTIAFAQLRANAVGSHHLLVLVHRQKQCGPIVEGQRSDSPGVVEIFPKQVFFDGSRVDLTVSRTRGSEPWSSPLATRETSNTATSSSCGSKTGAPAQLFRSVPTLRRRPID
jgi:hypothetical protein